MQRTPFDIPDQIREITDKSVAEAKKALEQYLDATQQAIAKAESSTRTVQEGAAEVNRQAFAFVEENVSASFELAQRLVQARTAEEIADRLSSAGAIAAPAVAPWSLLSNPQLQARNWLQYVDHPYVGTQVFPGFLWEVEPDEPSWDRPSGLVGECNREVLADLGFSEAEIEDLYAQGAVGDRYG